MNCKLVEMLVIQTAFFVLSGVGCRRSKSEVDRPNVLVVTFDTTRADRLSPYGYTLAQTPTLARLAKEGTVAAKHSTVAPITLPAHSSIFTGLYPPSHNVRDNGVNALSDDVTTLAERLVSSGYRTGAFVSAVVLEKRYNLTQGFQVYDDDLSEAEQAPMFMIRNRAADKTADKAIEWLEQSQNETAPFFGWVHFFDAHHPYSQAAMQTHLPRTPYDAEITNADAALGRIVSWLEEHHQLDNTLVIMTADHGESLDEHGEKTHGVFVYESTLHIPLIIRYPKNFPAGLRLREPTSAVDITPTVLDVVHLSGGDTLQGVSLLPMLERAKTQNTASKVKAPARVIYGESTLSESGFGMAPLYMIREGSWKYIQAPRPELYDLAHDGGEHVNRIAKSPQKAAELKQKLEALMQESERRAPPSPLAAAPMDDDAAEMLMALGYLAPGESRGMMAAMNDIDPKDGMIYHTKLEDARHAAQRGDWQGSIDVANELLAVQPKNSAARNLLGMAYQRSGDEARSEEQYEASLAAEPTQFRIHTILGWHKLKHDQVAQAKSHFEAVVALMPTHNLALAMLAYIAQREGNETGATQLFARAKSAGLDLDGFYRRLGDFKYERGDYTGALVEYRKVLSVHPHTFAALVHAGLAEAQLGNTAQAMTEFELAEDVKPDEWNPYYNQAWALARVGDVDAAISILEQAVHRGFHNVSVLENSEDWSDLRKSPDFETLRLLAYGNRDGSPKTPAAMAPGHRRAQKGKAKQRGKPTVLSQGPGRHHKGKRPH